MNRQGKLFLFFIIALGVVFFLWKAPDMQKSAPVKVEYSDAWKAIGSGDIVNGELKKDRF